MPGYHFYPPYYKILMKAMPDKSADWVFGEGIKCSIKVEDIVARDILFFEWCWMKHGVIWFLENARLVDFLIGSKFEKVRMSDIPETDDPIMLSYPDKIGEKLHGCLIRKTTISKRREELCRFFKLAGMDLGVENFYSDREETKDPETSILEISVAKKDERYRYIIPEAHFQTALDGEWWDDPKTHEKSYVPIEESDIVLQKAHFKIAIRALLYAAAFPEALKPGVPTKKQRMGIIPCEEKRGFWFTRYQEHRSSPSLHLRAAHARVLKDERYKRGPDGKPRIIPVSMAVVAGHHVEPSVLEKLRNDMLESLNKPKERIQR